MITRRPCAFHVHSAFGPCSPCVCTTERPPFRRLGVACSNIHAEEEASAELSIQPRRRRSSRAAGGVTKFTRFGAGGHSCPPVGNLSGREAGVFLLLLSPSWPLSFASTSYFAKRSHLAAVPAAWSCLWQRPSRGQNGPWTINATQISNCQRTRSDRTTAAGTVVVSFLSCDPVSASSATGRRRFAANSGRPLREALFPSCRRVLVAILSAKRQKRRARRLARTHRFYLLHTPASAARQPVTTKRTPTFSFSRRNRHGQGQSAGRRASRPRSAGCNFNGP